MKFVSLEIFTKAGALLDRGLTSLFKKAGQTDPNNQFIQQLYKQLGFNVDLMPYELKEYISQGYIINPHVYTVVNKIIRPASAVPHIAYEIIPDKLKELHRYKSALKHGRIDEADYYASKALKVANVRELQKLLEQPNENQSFQEWSEQGMGFELLTGEEFIYGLMPEGLSMFTKLYNMPPQLVKIKTGDWQNPIVGYQLDYFGFTSDYIPTDEVCHIKLQNPNYENRNELRGLSPMSALCKVVKKSNDSHIAQMRILQNGHPVGILSSAADRGMTTEQAKELKRNFRSTHQGAMNKGDVLLTSAQLNWVAMGLTTADLQLIESDRADLDSIARVYEVPLPLVKNEAATFNNMQEAQKIAWMDARIPLLTRRRDALNRWLIPGYKKKYGKDLYIDFDLATIDALRQNDKEVVDTLAKEIEYGMITPNEAREKRGREKSTIKEMDIPHIGRLRPIDTEYSYTNQPNNE